MAQTKWLEKYALGIEVIDKQHKKLVHMIAELETSIDAEQPDQDAMGSVYDALIDYVDEHFSSEESLLQEHAYPDFAEHRNEHGLFVSKLLGYKKKWVAGEAGAPLQALNFLRVWLINHIQGTDARYSEFLRGKGLR